MLNRQRWMYNLREKDENFCQLMQNEKYFFMMIMIVIVRVLKLEL